ncbi:ABC transporter permease [Demequina sp. NBRC 110053]|uniref:ABC transporter permease n=1 Tax=Demequina sp. NBRC 110053 TaxID=1570342 RepID=UPI0009FBD85D|nr:ABC transporter permease [Demequina sp. NBRC 110053]
MTAASARLLLLGTAGAARRLAGIVAGVAVAVAMLIVLLGTYLHMPDRDERTAWQVLVGERLETSADGTTTAPDPTTDQMLIASRQDYVHGQLVTVTAAAVSPATDVAFPHGLEPLVPGQFYASPAVADMIDHLPADQFADRYGELVGTLPDAMLRGPDERSVLVGAPWETVASNPNARVQPGFDTVGQRYDVTTYRVILAIGSIAMLVPIVLLISIVSQLGAAQRRERLATVRLIGAGRRAVAGLSALEMGAATAAGAVLGVLAALPLRAVASTLSINGAQSFPADLTPSPAWVIATIAGVTVLGAAVAWWQAYRDDVGAPGASRERAEKRVTGWRVTTLGVGLTLFAGSAWVANTSPAASAAAAVVLIASFAVLTFGIIIAGPWLTRAVSSAYGRVAARASAVVAAGRLTRHPRSTFRSVAGLVAAVFIVSVFAGVVSSVRAITVPSEEPGMLSLDVVLAHADAAHADAMVAAARDADGVERVVVGYRPGDPDAAGVVMDAQDARAIGATAVPDAAAVMVDTFAMLWGTSLDVDAQAPVPEPADGTEGLEPAVVMAVTDGSPAAIERARTALDIAGDRSLAPTSRTDAAAGGAADITQELAVLAYIGMAIAIGISALALAVATIAAALERRRTFGLLRLAGMPVAQLRGVVATEAAVPLASTLVASAGLGFLVAWILVITLGNGLEFTWPDGRYWVALVGSTALAALAVAASFGTVRRSTEIDSTRFE